MKNNSANRMIFLALVLLLGWLPQTLASCPTGEKSRHIDTIISHSKDYEISLLAHSAQTFGPAAESIIWVSVAAEFANKLLRCC